MTVIAIIVGIKEKGYFISRCMRDNPHPASPLRHCAKCALP